MILVTACQDFPAHARMVRAPLCPACVADPADVLRAAGWTPCAQTAGRLWRDPADGTLRTEAHALRLARKDGRAAVRETSA